MRNTSTDAPTMAAALSDGTVSEASLRRALPLSFALHVGVLAGFWLLHRAPVQPTPAPPLLVAFIAPAQAVPMQVVPTPPILPKPEPGQKPQPPARPPPPLPQIAVAPAPTMAAAATVPAMPAPPAPAMASAPADGAAKDARPAAPPVAPPVAPPAAPMSLGGELSLACPERPPPDYPPMSRRRGEAGRVVLRVELDELGAVTAARVENGSGFERLDQAALAAVKAWRCQPPRRDGRATRAVARQPFDFVLGATMP